MDAMSWVLVIAVAAFSFGGLSIFLMPYFDEWARIKHRELDNERRAIELGVPVMPKGFKK